MSNMTFKRQFENYRPNEYINAVRLGFNNEVTFISIPGEEYHSGPNEVTHLPPEQFATGPIIDRLAAYERTYMEPEEILDMKAEWACMKDKIKVLEKEIEAWKTDAKKWENRYTNAKVKFIEENSELKKELKEVKQDTQKWIDNRQGLRVEYDKVLHELTAVKDELAEARNIIKNREAEIAECRRVNKELREMYADMSDKALTLQEEHVRLNELFEDKSEECGDLHRENAVLKQNLNNVDGPRKYFEEKCALLEKENEELTLKLNSKKTLLNRIYGLNGFRNGGIIPKSLVDLDDLIEKLRKNKDISISVSQYDDSTTVTVAPWTPVTEEEAEKWSTIQDVVCALVKNVNNDKLTYTTKSDHENHTLSIDIKEKK